MADKQGVEFARDLERLEAKRLAPYALKSAQRRQACKHFRLYHADDLEYRTEYHRDRDRIVWSRAFKRLQHKTQVFPHYSEDHYRRRLTHSLEVAQIATTLARALKLNEVAAEAIALAHDLGHAPFGHAGEDALNETLLEIGSDPLDSPPPLPVFAFNHCVHGVEVVSRIEREYYSSDKREYGLNLTFDVIDGILKHMIDPIGPEDPRKPLDSVRKAVKYQLYKDLGNNKGSLEAQCVYFADKVAYLFGDLEDGLRRGIFTFAEMNSDPFVRQLQADFYKRRKPAKLSGIENTDTYLMFRRGGLATLILNCIGHARAELKKRGIDSVQAVLGTPERIVQVSPEIQREWEKFYRRRMLDCLFRHKDVKASEYKARRIVRDLFGAYRQMPDLIDRQYAEYCKEAYRAAGVPEKLLDIILARNYVAGMTDPFATNQHRRLFASSEPVTLE